ncbi:MAG: PIG-L family deacetylase [Anaerolineales bacterium]|nr:PIG-L family deacetylase [Anaerolineales bacterium]
MPALLCLIAHPDDETMLCGGTLALLARQGVAVHVLCLTRGEGGETGEPPRCERAELGALREQELVCAVGRLGGRSLTFLGYVDPEVAPGDVLAAPAHDPAVLTSQIVSSVTQFAPEVLLTHGTNGEYGHPAHRLLHQMARAALAGLGPAAPLFYSMAAAYPGHPYPRLANADDPADLVVDVSSALREKEAAALCHATQNALFVRRRSQAAGRPLTVAEVLLREESFRRQAPAAAPGDDAFRAWLSPWLSAGAVDAPTTA